LQLQKRAEEAPIKGFFGPFRWLSNFHFATITYNGEVYRTNEHAYQAAKHLDAGFRKVIAAYDSPRDAMKAGRSRAERLDWNDIKVQVMYEINRLKYQHPDLRQQLLLTGTCYLEETNTWGDRFWGVCNGSGLNMLGQVLMLVRDEIRIVNGLEPMVTIPK
jgi:ribA/ribD-fused uncharacterized protein